MKVTVEKGKEGIRVRDSKGWNVSIGDVVVDPHGFVGTFEGLASVTGTVEITGIAPSCYYGHIRPLNQKTFELYFRKFHGKIILEQ